MRTCHKCNRSLAPEEFYNSKAIVICRYCHSKRQREYRANNKDLINKRNREKRKPRDPLQSYLYLIKYKYNISKEDYLQLKEKQNNKCYICNKEQINRRLCIDHNHETGFVRALLCNNCNTAIGNCFEDISLLQKIIDYLNLFRNKNEGFKVIEKKKKIILK